MRSGALMPTAGFSTITIIEVQECFFVLGFTM